ncbi:DUF1499 domain-containing protein [Pelagibaculum spongiae]|uniref:DUF1499 domain-containing protein n=1 Tax=Pelagibaculum spongiae TaxID=2080658 RepID=A0A2V1GXB3_9GAMM|nr:DUF1499 domain-containing protein [Pelagibaculum spongiae]PVZ70293.1 DUF1499 domain-containing protein [Pelagibaculum spongiae]
MKYLLSAAMVMSLLGCAGTPVAGGLSDQKLADCASKPNCVCSDMAISDSHYIEPLAVQSVDDWNWLADDLAAQSNTEVVSRSENYLHLTFTTPLIRYTDDVELHFVATKKHIAVRSASRIGYSDLGANKKRVEMIREKLKQKI